ncbi:MAG: beta-N-acetylhexosaminidase [Tannerellaceae bacterium]|nr:beta-N-acetylhexosaminidase [Tannerellaceae bacterium]
MKQNTNLFIVCLLLILAGCEKNAPTLSVSVLPEPQEIVQKDGTFKAGKNWQIAYPESLATEAALVEQWWNTDYAIQLTKTKNEKKATLSLVLDNSILPEQAEGYLLDIDKKTISIRASRPVGILHGIQTLRQLMQEENGQIFAPTCTITDYPAFSWRAFMLDEARYFKGKEVVYELLDEMSRLKMNTFHWHLTNDQGWRIEIKKYPLLTEVGAWRDSSEIHRSHSGIYDGKVHGGFYIQDEIREIVNYAADRHIMIVPEVSMPGHATAAIAAYPWLGVSGKEVKVSPKFGVHYDVFDVSSPRVMEFFEDVIDEVIALFPAPVFHIGGDEVRYNHWNDSPKIQAYMRKNGLKTPPELQVFFTNHISNLLDSKGRIMMGWNEITGDKLHDYQEKESKETASSGQTLNPNTIVHFWKGDPKLIREALDKGYNIVNSYHQSTYLDYSYQTIPLEKAYHFNPIPEDTPAELQKKVLGLGCQMWGEMIPTVESMNKKIYPRIAAYAETGWTGTDKKDYDRFLQALEPIRERWSRELPGFEMP